MQDFHECPYCGEDLEQWSLRFYRSDARDAAAQPELVTSHSGESGESTAWNPGSVATAPGEGLTLLSLCPSDRCGYYVLRYRNGLMHWDRDVEAARLLRAVFGGGE